MNAFMSVGPVKPTNEQWSQTKLRHTKKNTEIDEPTQSNEQYKRKPNQTLWKKHLSHARCTHTLEKKEPATITNFMRKGFYQYSSICLLPIALLGSSSFDMHETLNAVLDFISLLFSYWNYSSLKSWTWFWFHWYGRWNLKSVSVLMAHYGISYHFRMNWFYALKEHLGWGFKCYAFCAFRVYWPLHSLFLCRCMHK